MIFAADPERFYPEGEPLTAYRWEASKQKVDRVGLTTPGAWRAKYSNTPLLLITYYDPPASLVRPKVSRSTANDEWYVTAMSIREKEDYDPWTNEEFEVYTKDDQPQPYDYQTTLIFDGQTHEDAAGRTVYFADINDTWVRYYMASGGIALVPLSDTKKRGWIAIEDDYVAGVHRRVSDPTLPYPTIAVYTRPVDVEHPDGTIIWGTNRQFYHYVGLENWVINPDDIIWSGAYEEFTVNSLQPEVEYHYALKHNDFWVQKKRFVSR